MTIAMAIIRDLFEGEAARRKLSYVAVTMMIVPMVAPILGAALLAWGGWRSIHAVLVGIGVVLLLAMSLGFKESARFDADNRMFPSVIARNYFRVLTNPICLGYILVNAMAFGALFSYVSGSAAYLIGVVGLTPQQYGLVFAATSLGIMAGAFVNGRLSKLNVAPSYPLVIGLMLAAVSAALLLTMALTGWMPLPVAGSLLILGTLAFGLVAPNALHEAMQPLPQIAGATGAAAGSIQMAVGAISSGLVAMLYDSHSALSMTFVMFLCSLLAVARPAGYAVSLP